MAVITIAGVKYPIPDQVANKPRKLVKQPHNEAGQPLFQFLVELFQGNEMRGRTTNKTEKPLSDEQLEMVVRAAYAGFPAVLESIDNAVGSRICKWRWLYNKGTMTNHQPPDICSFRYQDGKAVYGKSKLRELSTEEQRKICEKYGIADQRFQKRKAK